MQAENNNTVYGFMPLPAEGRAWKMTRKSRQDKLRQDEGGGLDRGEKSYTRPSRGQPGRGGRWRLCRNGSVFPFSSASCPIRLFALSLSR
jgi:hypothetical protein